MAYSDKSLLTDVDGVPIPQYYDPSTDSFKPMTQEVQLTGRNVEKVWAVDRVEIRDTSTLITDRISLTKYKEVRFWVKNSLDQDLKIGVREADPINARALIKVFDGTDYIPLETTITSNEYGFSILLNSSMPEIERVTEISFDLSCEVAPTSGNVRLWFEGVVN